MSRIKHYGDYLEKDVADILEGFNVRYVHEYEDHKLKLDFYLPDYDVYIEVKRFHAERSNRQLKSQDNVILIQGKNSIVFLKSLLEKFKSQ